MLILIVKRKQPDNLKFNLEGQMGIQCKKREPFLFAIQV